MNPGPYIDYFQFRLRRFFGGPAMNQSSESQTASNMTVEETKKYLNDNNRDTFTLLDVRQDWEYEEFHIPGAFLLPLSELADRIGELPQNKPVIVYCASGKRSAAAASLLAGQGFTAINMLGGAMAWNGHYVEIPADFGMDFFAGDESPLQLFQLAYAMEDGLGRFYQELSQRIEQPDVKELFSKLAGFEEKHKTLVFTLAKRTDTHISQESDLETEQLKDVLEGGGTASSKIEETLPTTVHTALEYAMQFEAMALDLYMRYAAKAEVPETAHALTELADEEKRHLHALGQLMQRYPVLERNT